MYRTSINFHKRLMRGEIPVPYIIIATHMGYRAYAEKELTKVFDLLGYIADGTYLADSSITAGSISAGIIEKSARVVSFGSFERNLQSLKDDVLGSYQSKTLQFLSVDLDNSDAYFAKLMAKEPFIGRMLSYYLGFEEDPQSEHLELFSGIITEMNVMGIATVEANEE